jgi:hypothetical protein
MTGKQDDSYSFSYPFEYIAANHGNDKYDIGTATMNVTLAWNDAEEGYRVDFDVPDMQKIDPSLGNGDARRFYEDDVYPRLMSDLAGLGIGPEELVWAGF